MEEEAERREGMGGEWEREEGEGRGGVAEEEDECDWE